MFSAQVEPRLARLSTGVRLVARELRVAGMGESDVDQRIAPIYTRHTNVQTTILTAPGEIQIHLRAWTADVSAAESLLQQIQESIVLALGEAVFTDRGESMEEVVARELTHASSHDCHGGELHGRPAGRAAHAHLGKLRVFSRRRRLLQQHAEIGVGGRARGNYRTRGAVSAEVAVALADGIRRRTGATLGVGITGVAGPTGGTPEKPVGTVHVAIADASGSKERGMRYPGERDRIRWQASQTALDLVRRYFSTPRNPRTA